MWSPDEGGGASFDGATFAEVARHLQGEAQRNPTPEAMLRASIGRYYYACYHALRRRFIRQRDWDKIKRTGHRTLKRAVEDKGHPEIASWLETLMILREHADYHIWPPKIARVTSIPLKCDCDWDPNPIRNCEDAQELAEWILGELDLLGP